MSCFFVITRFNLAVKYRYKKLYASSDIQNLWLDEAYLEKRFKLFEEYTFPSFVSQTDHDFRWIVLFHKDTPNRFKSMIQQYQTRLKEFEPVFLNDDESERLDEFLHRFLGEYHKKEGIISVRVDNDDIVHSTYIESIKREFAGCTKNSALSFKNGLQYDVRSRKCMRYSYENNHFIAIYSAADDDFVCALSFDHTKIDGMIDRKHKLVCNNKVPMWVEVVHDTNCINEIWTRPSKVFVPYTVKSEYPILKLKWDSRQQWMMYIVTSLPKAFIKMFIDVFKLIVIRIKG